MPTTRRGAHVSRRRTQKPQQAPATQRGGRPENKTEPRPRGAPNAKRGRRSQTGEERSKPQAIDQEVPATQPEPVPEGTAKVPRVYNELWASTPLSLSFVQHGNLASDPDTEAIALNLIDHIIKEENWNPALSQNKLCASCFFFASRVTKKNNEAADIAASFEIGSEVYASAMLAAINGPKYADDYTVRFRIAQALKMNAADVEWGYRILWEQKDSLFELIGEYASVLDTLPLPVGVEAAVEAPVKVEEEAALDTIMEEESLQVEVRDEAAKEAQAEELMKVVDQPLMSPADFELDEFEASVAEYE